MARERCISTLSRSFPQPIYSGMDSMRDNAPEISARGETFKRVLLVDSISSSLAVTEKMLLSEGYTVTAVESGIEALAILYEHEDEYDFVLTDIHLSDIEGFEFLDILEKESDMIVIVLSAEFSEEVVARSIDKGVCEFYEKPISDVFITDLWQTAFREKVKRLESFRGKSPLEDKREQFNGWTAELHEQFVDAAMKIGVRYVDSENLQKFMNVPGLSKQHISDRLQTYLPSLIKLEKNATMKQEQELEAHFFPKRVRRH